MSRGNPSVEYVLDRGIPYMSGPQWLGQEVLNGRWVLAAAGTHGKTTTSSMLAWNSGVRRDEARLPDRRGTAEFCRVKRAWGSRRFLS